MCFCGRQQGFLTQPHASLKHFFKIIACPGVRALCFILCHVTGLLVTKVGNGKKSSGEKNYWLVSVIVDSISQVDLRL